MKLLKIDIIYLIFDSKWVNSVHVVPKKRGTTIIKNENNELISTRTITGWCMCIDYRELNKDTQNDHFSFPFIDQMLERLAKNSYFCYLDGYSVFFPFKSLPILVTKKRPPLLSYTVHMSTGEIHLGYALPLLLFNVV